MKPLNLAAALGLPEVPNYQQKLTQLMHQTLQPTEPVLRRPIEQLFNRGSKRLRSSLLIAVTHSQGNEVSEEMLNAAAAIEWAHLASLVHDDLLDNAATRWGAPTISARAGNQQALLIGDYLFALAFQQAARISQVMGDVVADAIAKMIEGQSLETADLFRLNRPTARYNRTIRNKTAALFAAATELGALGAGCSRAIMTAFRQYGEAFGMAYQLIDDILDITSTPQLLKKPTNVDMPNGVYTLPVLLALKHPEGIDLRAHLQRQNVLPRSEIVRVLVASRALARAQQTVAAQTRVAAQALYHLPANPAQTALQAFPKRYMDWAWQQFDPALSL